MINIHKRAYSNISMVQKEDNIWSVWNICNLYSIYIF